METTIGQLKLAIDQLLKAEQVCSRTKITPQSCELIQAQLVLVRNQAKKEQ